MAALLKRQVVQLDDASRTWAVSRVLNLLEAPRWGPAENVLACATVSHVLRAGIASTCSEHQQVRVQSAGFVISHFTFQFQFQYQFQ